MSGLSSVFGRRTCKHNKARHKNCNVTRGSKLLITYGLGFSMPWRVTGASPSHPEIRRHACSWCKVKGWQQCTLYTPSIIAYSIKNVATSRPNPENCGSRSTCQRKASTVTSQVTWHVNAYETTTCHVRSECHVVQVFIMNRYPLSRFRCLLAWTRRYNKGLLAFP